MLSPIERGFVVFLVSGVCAACSGSDPPGGDDDLAGGCDIRRRGCQEAVFRAAAAVRGQTGVPIPEVRTISVADFAAELNASSSADAGTDAFTPALTLLGFLDPGASARDAANETAVAEVAAYYDDSTKSVTVLDRGPSESSLADVFELAHEFVHSLQDASVDLEAFQKQWVTSTDSHMGITSLVEGEATVLGVGVLSEAIGQPAASYRWSAFVDSMMNTFYDGVGRAGAPFFYAAQLLPYPLGTSTLYGSWLSEGNPAITRLYSAPMLSLLSWTDAGAIGPPTLVEPLDCHPTQGPPGFTGVDHDTLGLLGVLAMDVRLGFGGSEAYTQALEWRNDSLVIFRSDAAPDAYAVAWRIRLSGASALASMTTRDWSALGAGVTVQQFDRELLVLAAADSGVLATWTDASHCGTESELPAPPEAATSAPSALAAELRRPRGRPFGAWPLGGRSSGR